MEYISAKHEFDVLKSSSSDPINSPGLISKYRNTYHARLQVRAKKIMRNSDDLVLQLIAARQSDRTR